MDLNLTGKLVVVTGGSKGIGLACARAFLAEGAKVAIISRSAQNVERALAGLPKASGFTADLSDEADAARVVETIERDIGAIDVLVNSAGAAKRTPPADLSPAIYRSAFDAKFFSYVNIIDPVVKRMAERGSGTIVNVIGNGGKVASPIHIPGGAANAGLMLVTAGLAAACADRGVRVVAVNPGITETERAIEGFKADARLNNISEAESRQRSTARIPMGRAATPEEIADTVLYLASDKASYVTGVSVSMDGAAAPVVF